MNRHLFAPHKHICIYVRSTHFRMDYTFMRNANGMKEWTWQIIYNGCNFTVCVIIYKIMHELSWIMIVFGHTWSDLPMIFTSDEVTSENHWPIASQVTKIVIHGNERITVFLTRYLMSWIHNSAETNHRSLISPLSPRSFLISHCDAITVDLRRHTNVRY